MSGKTAEVFRVFLRLGLTSFGGPVAHLGYFRNEFVLHRRWLDEEAYASLLALCQFLPGPASSQMGMAIGLSRAGLPGALAAWCGFTLPSAVAMAALALVLAKWNAPWLGVVTLVLKLVAVLVVAQAVWGMARRFCRDGARALLAVLAAACVLHWTAAWVQVAVIAAAACAGLALRVPESMVASTALEIRWPRRRAIVALTLCGVLLLALPMLAATTGSEDLRVFAAFYRTGALVFGGGHVVLPLLQAETVGRGWIGADAFLAGYGVAQAMPGPLFTFAAFLGAALRVGPGGWIGAALCLCAIFLPSLLLVSGALPFWEGLRRRVRVQRALSAVNAAVVGLLFAALISSVAGLFAGM